MPPEHITDARPSQEPLQVILTDVVVMVRTEGSVITAIAFTKHPKESITATLYVPANNPVAIAVVCANGSSQRYVKGKPPPDMETVAEPSVSPLQLTFMIFVIVAMPGGISLITAVVDAVHPRISVTMTVYEPNSKFVAVAVI